MREELVRSLHARAPQIRERWVALLHAEPVNTPLAYPDSLVHLLDGTLAQIFCGLDTLKLRRPFGRRPSCHNYAQNCPCRRNPLITYFAAGDQAMREALILAQAATHSLGPVERDASLEELDGVFREIAHREIAAFCGLCQHRRPVEEETVPAGPLHHVG